MTCRFFSDLLEVDASFAPSMGNQLGMQHWVLGDVGIACYAAKSASGSAQTGAKEMSPRRTPAAMRTQSAGHGGSSLY
jgi:hypothetical protein